MGDKEAEEAYSPGVVTFSVIARLIIFSPTFLRPWRLFGGDVPLVKTSPQRVLYLYDKHFTPLGG